MIDIRPAVLRDASFVIANLRPLDRLEAFCQLPDDTKTHELAYILLMGSECWIAYIDDQPVAFFGTAPLNVVCHGVWALGTKRMARAVPAITRFFTEELGPELLSRGVTSMEARSLLEHRQAHCWMHLTGAVSSGEPFEFGKNGEKFVLFRWTTGSFASRSYRTQEPRTEGRPQS